MSSEESDEGEAITPYPFLIKRGEAYRLAKRAGVAEINDETIKFIDDTLDLWLRPMITDVVSVCTAYGYVTVNQREVFAVMTIHGTQDIIIPKSSRVAPTETRPAIPSITAAIEYHKYRTLVLRHLPRGSRLSKDAVFALQAAHENYLVDLISSGRGTIAGLEVAQSILLPRALSIPSGSIAGYSRFEVNIGEWYPLARLGESVVINLSKLLLSFLRKIETVATEIASVNGYTLARGSPEILERFVTHALDIVTGEPRGLVEGESDILIGEAYMLRPASEVVRLLLGKILYNLGLVILTGAERLSDNIKESTIAHLIRNNEWLSNIFPPWSYII